MTVLQALVCLSIITNGLLVAFSSPALATMLVDDSAHTTTSSLNVSSAHLGEDTPCSGNTVELYLDIETRCDAACPLAACSLAVNCLLPSTFPLPLHCLSAPFPLRFHGYVHRLDQKAPGLQCDGFDGGRDGRERLCGAEGGETLPLPRVFTAFAAKTAALSCVSTALAAKTLPLHCGHCKADMWERTLFVWSTDNGSPVSVAGTNDPLRKKKLRDDGRVVHRIAAGTLDSC